MSIGQNYCRYRYSPTELYQRTKPGTAPETHCGARTYYAYDEPELVPQTVTDDDGQPITIHVRTGRMLARVLPDPYCPAHGGTPEPQPEQLHMAELEAAHAAYLQLAGQYAAQLGVKLNEVAGPASIAAFAALPQLPAPTDSVSRETTDQPAQLEQLPPWDGGPDDGQQ